MEIRVELGQRSRDKEKAKAKQDRFFSARKQYEEITKLPLTEGLTYFYNGTSHTTPDQLIIDCFINDPNSTNHVEVAK